MSSEQMLEAAAKVVEAPYSLEVNRFIFNGRVVSDGNGQERFIAEGDVDALLDARAAEIRAIPLLPPAGTDVEWATLLSEKIEAFVNASNSGSRWWPRTQTIEAIAAALTATRQAALAEVVAWQPMDTAPKDGTRILIWFVHKNAKYCKDPIAEGYAAAHEAQWIDHNGGGWTWHGLCGVATLWQPLPAPPSADHLNPDPGQRGDGR